MSNNTVTDVYITDEMPTGHSMTELATSEFLRQVKDISGVTVECHGGASLADQTIVVGVASIMSPEARSVVRLKGEMHRKYLGALLNIDVTELPDQVRTAEVVSVNRC